MALSFLAFILKTLIKFVNIILVIAHEYLRLHSSLVNCGFPVRAFTLLWNCHINSIIFSLLFMDLTFALFKVSVAWLVQSGHGRFPHNNFICLNNSLASLLNSGFNFSARVWNKYHVAFPHCCFDIPNIHKDYTIIYIYELYY
jgi:hypothetical protein